MHPPHITPAAQEKLHIWIVAGIGRFDIKLMLHTITESVAKGITYSAGDDLNDGRGRLWGWDRLVHFRRPVIRITKSIRAAVTFR